MHGIKLVSSIATLVAFAEAQQQFVMLDTEATCTAKFGTWANNKCTAETSAATTVRKNACSTEHGTWNGSTKVCTAETADAKAKRECVSPSTWVAASGSGANAVAAKCWSAEETCASNFGTWAAGEGTAAGVCTAETAAAKTLREFECKQAYGSWASGKCTDETADAKLERECDNEWGTFVAATGSGANVVAASCTAETADAKAERECDILSTWTAGVSGAAGTCETNTQAACLWDNGTWAAGASGAAGVCTEETADAKLKRECNADLLTNWVPAVSGGAAAFCDANTKASCDAEFGTFVAKSGSTAASCTAETADEKAIRVEIENLWTCAFENGTWADGASGAAGVCTAETAAAKTARVNAATTACEGTTASPTGMTYKAATEECFKANWHQEAMCAVTSDGIISVDVSGEPYFVEDATNLNWCLDYTTEFSMDCDTGCSDWGETCVPEEFAHICEDNEFAAAYGSNAGLIVGVLFGVLGAVAVGIVVYCFCCKKNDDDYQKA